MHVGGTKMILFDTRVIAASNRNLWELVEQKRFREDLYYRLNVLELNIMPLRERKADIEALLSFYHWPGNVRELKNFAKMLIASLDSQYNAREIVSLMAKILSNTPRSRGLTPVIADEEAAAQRLRDLLSKDSESEFQKILAALENARGNQSEAAKQLGISRVTLWRKIKHLEN